MTVSSVIRIAPASPESQALDFCLGCTVVQRVLSQQHFLRLCPCQYLAVDSREGNLKIVWTLFAGCPIRTTPWGVPIVQYFWRAGGLQIRTASQKGQCFLYGLCRHNKNLYYSSESFSSWTNHWYPILFVFPGLQPRTVSSTTPTRFYRLHSNNTH